MDRKVGNTYFTELRHDLQREGFTISSEKDSLLSVEIEGQHLCQITDSGGVRYWKEDVAGDNRSEALDKVVDIAKTTAEYMSQMESAPQLTASGLEGDYRLLADFNGVVLAGHQTQYGAQFITWERSHDRASLEQGHYYGPGGGVENYTAAKRDFAVRSDLVPRSALFAPEQLTEVYRSIHETLDSSYPITDERRKSLESAAEQIERIVPDLEEQVCLSNQKELELAEMGPPEDGGMKFF